MYVLNIIHYQNYVNHAQYHPGQEAVGTVSGLTIFSKKTENDRLRDRASLPLFSGKMIEIIGFYHYD